VSTEALEYQVSLTDEMLDEARAFEGMDIRTEPWNLEATLDTIRHYAWGIGDANPLWCEEAYGAATPYGGVLAPPTFLYTIFDGAIGLGMIGIQPIYAGTDWEFERPVRLGDRITADAVMGPVVVKSGRHSDRFAIQEVRTTYRNQDGKTVAVGTARTFRVPRSGVDGGLRYTPRAPRTYSEPELEEIRRAAVAETPRGGEPRHYEDVSVGDEIPQVIKGPIDQITMTAYYAGCPGSPGYKACEVAWRYRTWAIEDPSRLPNNYDTTYFSEKTLPSLGHQNHSVAHEIGMPGAYNNGPQKCGWMAHPVTDWMGDAGFLTGLNVRLRRPDVFGDTVRIGGTVVEKLAGDRVRIQLAANNQDGETTAEGEATVRLPTAGASGEEARA
jgi:acyl dehydratase